MENQAGRKASQENERTDEAKARHDIPLLAGLSSAALALALIVGTVTFILGLVCGTRMRRKSLTLEERCMEKINSGPKEIQMYEELDITDPREGKLYEELKIVETPRDFNCRNNVAYGEIKE